MNKTNHILMCSLTASAAIVPGHAKKSNVKDIQKKYNIVYIMTDDHTAQMMSCYDDRYIETPNLDRIAEDGVRFTNSSSAT